MIEYILFVVGIIFLIKGANFLVDGSSSLARKLRIPTLVVGLTIVAFGTSMPELVVNIIAALRGSTEVAFGNVIGSNMANILLILGIVAIISPIKIERSTVWKTLPFALLSVIVLFLVSNYILIDNINLTILTRVSGLIFLCFFGIFIYYALGAAKQNRSKVKEADFSIGKHENSKIFLLILVGLLGLYFGGKWTVDGAIFIAQQFGMSEFLISATIIAVGTSFPELVTGITAARRKETGLAVGTSVGSNIFNIFWILGVTAIIAPVLIPKFINTDIILLGLATFLLFLFMFVGKKQEFERWQGVMFILLYIAYIIFIGVRG